MMNLKRFTPRNRDTLTGTSKSLPQYLAPKGVLRESPTGWYTESTLVDFHELRQGFSPPDPCGSNI